MKRGSLLALLLVLCLAFCMLAGCGEGTKSPAAASETAKPAGNAPLVFVGADKTNWDKALGIGDYAYNIALILNDDGTVTMNATCAGAGASGEPESNEDFSEHDFTQTGSWTKEEGYGYTVTLGDYTTKTDYDKASARQYMYFEIKNGDDTSGLVQLLAKDTGFRTEIAEDYDIFEVRDAKLVFVANGTAGNGNATQTHLYLEEDGTANALVQQGSSPSYSRGDWTENEDKSITVNLGANSYTADYCDAEGREGYRIIYNGSTMYATLSGDPADYVDQDFDGETLRTLSCGERDYTVNLTEKGIAGVFNSSGARVASGKYTEDDGVLTVDIGGNTIVSEDGIITLQFSVAGGRGPFGGTTTVERSFPIDGSVPEAVSDASGEASGETADQGSDETSAEPADDASAESAAEPAAESAGDASGEPAGDASGEPAGDASGEPAGDASGEPAGDASGEPAE